MPYTSALIVGSGLSASLARAFAKEGLSGALAVRSAALNAPVPETKFGVFRI